MAESVERRARAAKQLNRHEHRTDGAAIAASLASGLDYLRDSLYLRMHRDVEKAMGVDSLWMPISEMKTEHDTKTEIDLYQIVESAAAVAEGGYLAVGDDWYLHWLCRFRLGSLLPDESHMARLADYSAQTSDQRRLAFSDVLGEVLPESRRAPLILFRLMPLCVKIATALAFGANSAARAARHRQTEDLPAIAYCSQCHGDVMENGEHCRACGNPLWKFDWLTATD